LAKLFVMMVRRRILLSQGNKYVLVVLFVTFSFGLVGWVDDYKKVVEKNSKGLPAKWKYLFQSVFGLAAAIILYVCAETPAETTL